tara:strand:+ start:1892 stop:3157 length:1266 start_codon:yes stop_codon:yes gene_type:complete
MASRYDLQYTERSLLDIAYKGLYLMQAMGQFSKANAFRDDISVRMNTLLGKLNFENPSDVNEALMGAIDEMAFNDEGEYVDNQVIAPFHKAAEAYYGGIKAVTDKKEAFDEDFFNAMDKVYLAQKKGGEGYYDSSAAIETLNSIQNQFIKNARFYSTQDALAMQKEFTSAKEVMSVLSYMEAYDLDKEMAGVQLDLKNMPGADTKVSGLTFKEIFETAQANVELGNFAEAKKYLGKLEVRDKLNKKLSKEMAENLKTYQASLGDDLSPLNALAKTDENVARFVANNSKFTEHFEGNQDYLNKKVWKNLFNQKYKGLQEFVKGVDDSNLQEISEMQPHEFLSEDVVSQIKSGIIGGKFSDWKEYSKEDSKSVADAVQSYVNYLRAINSQYLNVFGEELFKDSNPNVQDSFLSDLQFNVPYKQ